MGVIKAIFSLLWDLIQGLVGLVIKKDEKPLPGRPSAPSVAAPTPATAPKPAAAAPKSAPAPAATRPPANDPFTILTDEPKAAAPVEAPAGPRILQPKVLMPEQEPLAEGEIRIKAQPSKAGDECKFMVSQALFEGHSWVFANKDAAKGSPLAERIFAIDDVESLTIYGSTATITRKSKTVRDWRPLAKEVGAAIRAHLASGEPPLARETLERLPSENEILEKIQHVIDTEVNPGVAAHGGIITLTGIEGNTVRINMGGGCQGCSAADLTLKEGIHNTFRRVEPFLGAILDETNHNAGENPYFR